MNDDLSQVMNIDFSDLIESSKKAIAEVQPAHEALCRAVIDANQAWEGFNEVIATIAASVQEFGRQIYSTAKPLRAINKLGDAQFVYWSYLDDDFVEEILSQEDTNCVLQNRFCEGDANTFNEIADECLKYKRIDNYTYIFEQCINAFQNGDRDLAIIGLCSIVDGLLSDISGDSTHVISDRYDEILDRLREKDTRVIDNDEVALFSLVITYSRTIKIYNDHFDFSQEEPSTLNRHWIMHGRSKTEKTELDCLKILNMIYGLLLMDDFINETDIEEKTV